MPFIGLVDPDLPDLPPHIADLADSLSPHTDIPALAPGRCCSIRRRWARRSKAIWPRSCAAPGLTKAALIRDFMPFDHQESYLTAPRARLKYFSDMAWLRHYDLFFPISDDTDQRLKALYGAVDPG